MADAISIQELIDARTDAKTLEEAVNGDAVTTVLSRLGETYPTLSNALNQIDSKLDSADSQIKQGITNLFENGSLPAVPFATKALMTASVLIDGKYAMVTDDNNNNGLYVKAAGAWVKSKYDPSNLDRLFSAESRIATSTIETSKANISTQAVKMAAPASVFGNSVLSYYDYQSFNLASSGKQTTGAVVKKVGSGKYPVSGISGTSVLTRFARYPNNVSKYVTAISSDPDNTFYDVNWDVRMLDDIKKANNLVLFCAANITSQAEPDKSNITSDIFIETDNLRFRTYRINSVPYPVIFAIEQKESGAWVEKTVWQTDYSLIQLGNGAIKVGEYPTSYIALDIDFATGSSRLIVNNVELKPSGAISNGNPFLNSTMLRSRYYRRAVLGSLVFANSIHVNSSIDVAAYIIKYLGREQEILASDYRGTNHLDKNTVKDRYFRNLIPRPTTIAGSYNIKHAEYIKQNFTEGAVVKGNMPDFVVPNSPNVAPWNQPHDPLLVDGSVTRLCAMPYPSAEKDTSRVLLIANAIYYPPNSSAGVHYMCAYESTDGGANFSRMDLGKPFVAPHAPHATATSSTINNVVVGGQTGRYFYVGDYFPDGYQPWGMTEKFKYFFLSETTNILFGCTDVLDVKTYKRVQIYQQSRPVPSITGNYDRDMIATYAWAEIPEHEGMPGNEEKLIGYDHISNRFYRVKKITEKTIDTPETGASEAQDNRVRSLVISWSEVGDITRWGAYEEFITATRGFYQNYDLDIVKVTDSFWAVMVFRYTDYGPVENNTTPYAQQNLKMDVDLYVSRDQLKTPPVLYREKWMSNNQQQWASGTLWAFGHPFDKSKIYVNGGIGLHAGYQPNSDQSDYQWKVALTNYQFPVNPTPDTKNVTGVIKSRVMDGTQVDKVRCIASDGFHAVRVLNTQGVPFAGMDYSDFRFNSYNELATWNGLKELPNEAVQLEIILDNSNFGGLYPMKELYKKF